MSEYQYYEFQAVDRPLTRAEQDMLRGLSTRARITATSFVNHYDFGEFGGNPATLMESVFDLHVYLANWGQRHFAMSLPTRLVDQAGLSPFIRECDDVRLRKAGDRLVLDVTREEMDVEDWDDGSGWLAALAPLRSDVLAGDLRVFYLMWLMALEGGAFQDDEPEPMGGLGPLSGALDALASFFMVDADLVEAAAERGASESRDLPREAVQAAIRSLPEEERTDLLLRLHEGGANLAAEVRRRVRERAGHVPPPEAAPARTVGELKARAEALRRERQRAADEKAAAEARRREAEQAEARRARLVALRQRGEGVWRDVDTEIERRNASSYGRAVEPLVALRAIAEEDGSADVFAKRLSDLRSRHQAKGRFIERLDAAGLV